VRIIRRGFHSPIFGGYLLVESKDKKFDIFEHELVPKHILLNESEVKSLLASHHLVPHQLPYIKASDPAARDVDAKPGNIIKIIRKSPTAKEAVTYRYVIEG
jgi:DNA-directed RNA polymerase subunit H